MLGVSPVLDMLHQLGGREKVSGAIDDGSISDMSGQITVRLAAGELAAELSRIDGSGAEGAMTAFLHCLLHLFLDGYIQI